MARTHITGTVVEAIKIEENLLNRKLPESFKIWLLQHNGQDLAGIHIFPVRDERDTRKTWESLAYNLAHEWPEWWQSYNPDAADYSNLLPFADFGNGRYFCFDYSAPANDGEWPVVLWSHQTGKVESYASDFRVFAANAIAGELT